MSWYGPCKTRSRHVRDVKPVPNVQIGFWASKMQLSALELHVFGPLDAVALDPALIERAAHNFLLTGNSGRKIRRWPVSHYRRAPQINRPTRKGS
jgi:hypothetical protein